MRIWACVVVLASCGRVNFDPVAEDGNLSDARASTCSQFGPWGPSRILSEIGSGSIEWGPWIADDRLEILFSSDRPNGAGMRDIYRATRSSATLPFDPPQLFDVSTGVYEDNPFLSANGLSVWFDRERIYRATRADRTAIFSNAAPAAEFSATAKAVSLTADELLITFTDSTNDEDIFIARRANPTDPFGSPEVVTALSGVGRDRVPAITGDGRIMLFLSDRFATLESIMQSDGGPDAFTPPVFFAPAMGTEVTDPFISGDGRTVVWGSNASGNYEIHIVERECI